jgi:hypothetical protein
VRCLNRFPKKSSNNKLHGNTSSGSRVVACGRADRRTDITKLIIAFRNFANALKNVYLHCIKDVYEKNCVIGNSAKCVRTLICLQRTIFVQLFQQQFQEFRLKVKKKKNNPRHSKLSVSLCFCILSTSSVRNFFYKFRCPFFRWAHQTGLYVVQ